MNETDLVFVIAETRHAVTSTSGQTALFVDDTAANAYCTALGPNCSAMRQVHIFDLPAAELVAVAEITPFPTVELEEAA